MPSERRPRRGRHSLGSRLRREADDIDAATRSGWSVVVTGRATVVRDPAEHERLSRTGPRSWTPLRDPVFVRIESELITGRELPGALGTP